jgi:hypothetical protein
VPIVLKKSWNLNFLEPSGHVQACNGIALPLHFLQAGNNSLGERQQRLVLGTLKVKTPWENIVALFKVVLASVCETRICGREKISLAFGLLSTTNQSLDLDLKAFQKGPFYFGIKVFNHLPTSIKNTSHDINQFRSVLKYFLLIK